MRECGRKGTKTFIQTKTGQIMICFVQNVNSKKVEKQQICSTSFLFRNGIENRKQLFQHFFNNVNTKIHWSIFVLITFSCHDTISIFIIKFIKKIGSHSDETSIVVV